MKPRATILVLRGLMTWGVLAIALSSLVACATTSTTPVSRQADPSFARKLVTYPTRSISPSRSMLHSSWTLITTSATEPNISPN